MKHGCCFCGETIENETIAIAIHFNYPPENKSPQKVFADRNCFHQKIVAQFVDSITDEPGFNEYPNK